MSQLTYHNYLETGRKGGTLNITFSLQGKLAHAGK